MKSSTPFASASLMSRNAILRTAGGSPAACRPAMTWELAMTFPPGQIPVAVTTAPYRPGGSRNRDLHFGQHTPTGYACRLSERLRRLCPKTENPGQLGVVRLENHD